MNETESFGVSDRSLRLLTAIVAAVYVAIHLVSLSSPWFPADDAQQLAYVRALDTPWRLLGVDSFGLFRPVKNILFRMFAGLEPLGMPAVRSVAVALGLLAFIPVLAFFRRVFRDRALALLAASFWLLAPTLVSSVAWLSCANIMVMCGFSAAVLVCHDRNRPFLASLFLFLACLSYECAVAVFPCVVVFDFFLRGGRLRERRFWGRYALYAGVAVAFLLLRGAMGSVHTVNGSFANCTRLDIVLASAYFSCQHFLSWVWPFGRMTVFGGYAAGSVPGVTLVFCWVIVVAMGLSALALRRRNPVLGFGLALALVGFLPVSNVTGVGNGPYGDYYLGISSFGLASACCALCRERVLRLVVPILRVGAVAAAFQWSWLWADGYRAYFRAAENFPGFFGNKLVLVGRLCDQGMFKAALRLGEDVEALVGGDSGQMAGVHLMRALYEMRTTKDADKALLLLEKSRKMDDFGGPLADRSYYVGCVYEDLLNDKKRAEEEYSRALRGKWSVDSVPMADRLARLLAVRGEVEAAIAIWEKALRLSPRNEGVRHNLETAKAERAAKRR